MVKLRKVMQKRIKNRSIIIMEQSFGFAATKEAFQVLSSSLYSNPKLAIIRALSTNANDAHKQAGKEDYRFNTF